MQAIKENFLETEGHKIYYACYGNPDGKKYLFVHGGPGAGTSETVLNFFNLETSMVVLVDQRGCGKSLPLGELKHNNTNKLISDFEQIREILGIKSWILFGGSWGSTLSLAYAQSYPHVVDKLILRGIFLGDRLGTKWLTADNGASRIWPEAWHELLNSIPELKHHKDPCAYLYQQVCTGNKQAAMAFARWEGSISCHKKNPELIAAMSSFPLGYTIGKIELHFMENDFFLEKDQIINNLDKITMPLDIVHGRYDIVCPLDRALELANIVPHSNIYIMPNSGHSALEPEIFSKLCELT